MATAQSQHGKRTRSTFHFNPETDGASDKTRRGLCSPPRSRPKKAPQPKTISTDNSNSRFKALNKKLKSTTNSAVDQFICPITQELPLDPVTAEDGRIYERSAISRWLKDNQTSPITKSPMGSQLLESVQARNMIDTLVRGGCVDKEKSRAWHERLKDQETIKKWRAANTAESLNYLANAYTNGTHGLAPNSQEAAVWHAKAARKGHADSMTDYALALTLPGIYDGAPRDRISFSAIRLETQRQRSSVGSSTYWLTRAAFAEEPEERAMLILAVSFLDGSCMKLIPGEIDVAVDRDEGGSLMQKLDRHMHLFNVTLGKSADDYHYPYLMLNKFLATVFCVSMSECYSNGWGCEASAIKAKQWLRRIKLNSVHDELAPIVSRALHHLGISTELD